MRIIYALFDLLCGSLFWPWWPGSSRAVDELWPLKQESNTSTAEKEQQQRPSRARFYTGFALFLVLMLCGIYIYLRCQWRLK